MRFSPSLLIIGLAALSVQAFAEVEPIQLDTPVTLDSLTYSAETNTVTSSETSYKASLSVASSDEIFKTIKLDVPEAKIVIDPFDEVLVVESSVTLELTDTDGDLQYDIAETIARTSLDQLEDKCETQSYEVVDIAAMTSADDESSGQEETNLCDSQNLVFSSGVGSEYTVAEVTEGDETYSVIQATTNASGIGMFWSPNVEGDVYFEARVGKGSQAEFTFDVLVNDRYFGAIPINETDGWTKFRLVTTPSTLNEELVSLVVFEFKKSSDSSSDSVLQIRKLFAAGFETDSDRDGLPDKDEIIFDLNPATDFLRDEQGNVKKDFAGRSIPDLTQDAEADFDGDGLDNITEYRGERSNWRNANTDGPDQYDQPGIKHCKDANDKVDELPGDPTDCTDTDRDRIGNNTDDDDDGDGIPDSVESSVEFPFLNPLDRTDGDEDFDRDGLSNSDEYKQGSSLTFDDQPPRIINAPRVKRVDATGDVTGFDFKEISAYDGLDRRAVDVWRKGIDEELDSGYATTQLLPGTYEYTWVSFDGEGSTRKQPFGNQTTVKQTLIVAPLASFSQPSKEVSDEQTAEICLEINGTPERYPVDIDLNILQVEKKVSSNILIDDLDELEENTDETTTEPFIPLRDELNLSISDGELSVCSLYDFSDFNLDKYDVEVSIRNARNASVLANAKLAVVKEANPIYGIELDASQNGIRTRQFLKDQGIIQIRAITNDSVKYNWSGSDGLLVDSDGNESNDIFVIDPQHVDAGTYLVRLSVEGAEATNSKKFTLRDLKIRIMDQSDDVNNPITLQEDNDLDGIPDSLEGGNAVDSRIQVDGETHMITAKGLKVTLGDDAFTSGSQSGLMGVAEFKQAYSEQIEDNVVVDSVVSFNIEGLAVAGARVPIVIKLNTPLANTSEYYKLREGRWVDFDQSSGDQYLSTESVSGICPDPGATAYRAGLSRGNDCILLWITDGGPNDDDLIANKAIKDPGGIGEFVPDQTVAEDEPPVPRMSGGALGLLSLLVVCILSVRRLKLV